MMGNSTVRDPDPRNLIVATLDGIGEQRFPNHGAMQPMPGFARKLNDKEMSELVNFMRANWGGHAAAITQENVKALR
jgi:mono/diheme cytochrome c family protein